jgi:hypothetical protein
VAIRRLPRVDGRLPPCSTDRPFRAKCRRGRSQNQFGGAPTDSSDMGSFA